MENFDQPMDMGMEASKDDGLIITEEVRQYWKQIAVWTQFFAILLFILFGLASLFALSLAFAVGAAGLIGSIMVIGLYGAVLFFPALYYYRFSTQMKEALRSEDNGLLDQSFMNLKRFYRYVGILLIVLISLYVVFFLTFGAAMMSRGF
ncbi:MAG: DUF5362 family protein [Saprospiraceae bacterium]|nr:hypothetical protein [Saprospiraceae bacterium]MCB9345434.1 hypothetical protein [Lewinellaceae bacterium]